PAVDALAASGLDAAARAARAGAEATAGMERAGTGRSSYLAGTDLKGHPDPGAVAVATAFEALASGAK
ncbi:DAK2 domain-containing protein, partial [Methylorubrum rhodesianum]